mmetsp:Transcript_79246/g.206780  ORF Transcript_79246/g.206780 Transcript_79246/m.206780 type:complete len:87 (+) Transcript_79246:237-497(+)
MSMLRIWLRLTAEPVVQQPKTVGPCQCEVQDVELMVSADSSFSSTAAEAGRLLHSPQCQIQDAELKTSTDSLFSSAADEAGLLCPE